MLIIGRAEPLFLTLCYFCNFSNYIFYRLDYSLSASCSSLQMMMFVGLSWCWKAYRELSPLNFSACPTCKLPLWILKHKDIIYYYYFFFHLFLILVIFSYVHSYTAIKWWRAVVWCCRMTAFEKSRLFLQPKCDEWFVLDSFFCWNMTADP